MLLFKQDFPQAGYAPKHNFPSRAQSLEWRPPEKWHIASMNKDAQ